MRKPPPVAPEPSPPPAIARGWFNPLDIACIVFVLLTIAVGIWAVAVFRVRTVDGTLVVEVNEPNPDVYVDGEKVTVAWQNGGVKAEVTVKPGTRKVELKKDGFRAFGEEVILEDHGRTLLHARLDPIKSATETPVAPTPPVDASAPEIKPVTRTVYLSDLDETDWSGHADFGKNGSSKTADVAVNGIKFHKGLSTHPTDRGSASVKYRLAGLDATAFVTKVAINDSTLATIPTLLTFQVLGDGEILWTSTPTRQKGQMQECQISVKDVRVLELRVNCPGWYHGAHAVWLDPYLLLSSPRNEVEPAAKGSLKTITNLIAMKLTLIPAGEFDMGSSKAEDQKASDAEQPRHHVRITRPFYMGVTEVTQGQYRNVTGQSPSEFHGSDDLPVDRVSWLDAVAFCNTLSTREKLTPYYRVNGWAVTIAGGNGYRLPTEAEWEYACRAGTTTIYSFGNDASQLGDFAWFGPNSHGRKSVGEKPANAFGLCDMHGSVFEWCWDGFDPRYYSQSPPEDPTGPSAAPNRVHRGGGCTHGPESARSADRASGTPDFRNLALGFRVARDLNGLLALDSAARAPTNAPSSGRPKRPAGSPPQLSKSALEKRDQPVAAVDLLPAGSVWKGTRSYRKGGYAGNTVSYELYVRERDGTTFKGYKIDNGKNRLEIEGEIDGGTISWSERLGTTSEVHFRAQGKLKAEGITFNFQGVPFFIEGDGDVQRK